MLVYSVTQNALNAYKSSKKVTKARGHGLYIDGFYGVEFKKRR